MQAHTSAGAPVAENAAAHGRLHDRGDGPTTVLGLGGIRLQDVAVDAFAALRRVLGNLTFPEPYFQLPQLLFG